MKSPPPMEIFIIRAAAFAAATFSELPYVGQPPAPPGEIPAYSQSPDPLANILLQLATSVLTNLPQHLRQQTAIILGTPHGCLHADWEFDRSRRDASGRYASPAAFSRTLPSTIPAELSVKLGLRGPLLTISAGPASTAIALHRAASWMRHLQIPWCLTGGFDGGTAPATQPRAALLLLSQTAPPTSGKLLIAPDTPIHSNAAPAEDSLARLISGMETPHSHLTPISLAPGIQLILSSAGQ